MSSFFGHLLRRNVLPALAALFFLNGVLFAVWAISGLRYSFMDYGEPFLPPAGAFLEGPEKYSFAVISDTGMRTEPYHKILEDAKRRNVKFILHLGDQARRISGNHFEHVIRDLRSVVGDIPVYAVPGNHDVLKDRVLNYKFYKGAFGQPYYWFGYGDTLFIMLDTASSEFDDPRQIAWLRDVLSRMRGMFASCVVCMHVPPDDPRPDRSYSLRGDGVDELRAILKPYEVNAIFAGHIHRFLTGEFAGAPMYITPSSGQKLRDGDTLFGYLLCVYDQGQLQVEHIDVTKDDDRDYLIYALSTGIDGVVSANIAFASFIVAFLLLALNQVFRRGR